MTIKTFAQKIHKKIALLYGAVALKPRAVNILDRHDEWDVLIILDGCRFDTFFQVNTLPGKLEQIVSLGSCTPEWARAALPKIPQDTIYLSGNPFVSEFYLEQWFQKIPFFKLVELWDSHWDTTYKTVTAEVMFNQAKKLYRKFPTHHHVIHCMQPHHPFIGKTRIDGGGWKRKASDVRKKETVYELLESGKITREHALKAYQDNLAYILRVIAHQDWLLQSGKRIVLSSDHGNCFGEYGVYSHPEKMSLPELLEVPYFQLELSHIN